MQIGHVDGFLNEEKKDCFGLGGGKKCLFIQLKTHLEQNRFLDLMLLN